MAGFIAGCLPVLAAKLVHAQQNPLASVKPSATGRIAGVLKDQSGAVVPGAKIEVGLAPGFKRSLVSDQQGRFVFRRFPWAATRSPPLPPGFDIAILHDLSVTAGTETAVNIALKIAPARTVVEVNGSAIRAHAATPHMVDAETRRAAATQPNWWETRPASACARTASLPPFHFFMGWETNAPSWWWTA